MKRRLTMAQAVVAYLQNQYSSRDGKEHRFIPGIFGIFGHGNVAGIGQALEQQAIETNLEAIGHKIGHSGVKSERSVKANSLNERPETWVTFRTGHIGNTSSLGKGGSDALEGVFGHG